MESFYDKVTHWQPFFSTVAGATATLAGLLFIALSINRERIIAAENRDLLRSAKRAFGDYLFAMFIAMLFLMPNHEPVGLALPLVAVAVVRIAFLIGALSRSSNKNRWCEQFIPAIACGSLVVVVVGIYRGEMMAAFLLVLVIAFLLYNATMNAWELLIMEKQNAAKSVELTKGVSP